MKAKTCLALALGCALALSVSAQNALTIAVIPKGTTHDYWKAIHAGAVKAQRELQAEGVKVELLWKGPLREDDREQQIQVVENFRTMHVSGMVLAPLDSHALVAPVVTASKSKIPIVIFDSGLQTDKYVSYVATDNHKGGELGAAELGRLLGGQGKVILLRYAVGSASTEEREAGFLDGMKSKFPGIQIISSDQHAGPTRETAYQASQNLLNRFGREVNGVFCPNENSTVGMAKALRDIGKAGGKVKMVGFDSGVQSVADLKNGDVQGLVLQNPLRMGYLSVLTLVKHIKGEKVETRIDTGVQIVTPQNMNEPEMKELLSPPVEKYLN